MAHVLVVTYPLQGHLNPTLEFARRLAGAGARVTFLCTVSAYRRGMIQPEPPTASEVLSYASFSDGHDDGFPFKIRNDDNRVEAGTTDEKRKYTEQFKQAGAQRIRELAGEGPPLTCVVYSLLQTWAASVAGELGVPAFLLWIQPAAVLAVYYHYFHGADGLIDGHAEKDSDFALELPHLPALARDDLPSFLLPSDPHSDYKTSFREQFEALDKEAEEGKSPKPRVLVNTFPALENEALQSIAELELVCVGPLITFPSKASGRATEDCIGWLDSKPASSVVFVSFGSVLSPCKGQMEGILEGLLETGRPFLWVLIEGSDPEAQRGMRDRVVASSCGKGLVVSWCSQLEVLSHPSTGCFVTHCGWNSTSESLTMGVPMVCFPQWTDQTTNAKLVESVWRAGVRVRPSEGRILKAGELRRCVEDVMEGKRGAEMRENARKWREQAGKAVSDDGDAHRNIRVFVAEMARGA